MVKTLKEAMRTAERGLKVIIADGECQLARQRRVRAEDAEKLKRGERVTRTRYGVDDEICTGDHSCIRLSGCPSLTVKPSPDPLRTDPVATVIESCVGCGLCGEVAHAAVLCPSFYRAEIVRNATVVRTAFACIGVRPAAVIVAGSAAYGTSEAAAVSGRRVPITLLIAALGGEGGGVLTDWIVSRGGASRLSGAVDLDPRRRAAHRRHHLLHRDLSGARRASSAASARCSRSRPASATSTSWWRANCWRPAAPSRPASSRRTARSLIASTSRFYAMDEKIAMGDGRFDRTLIKAIAQHAQRRSAVRHGGAGKQAARSSIR